MAITVITRTICDRCGHATSDEDEDARRWGWVNAVRCDAEGPRIGGTPDRGRFGDDLCPGCLDSLFLWWSGATAPSSQPVAPPAPTPPILKLSDRVNAIEQVVLALKTRTDFVVQVLRETPTAILSGDVIPGTMFGIEDTAAAIVDGVLDRLGIPIPGQRRRTRTAVTTASSGGRPDDAAPLTDSDAPAVPPADVSAPKAAQSKHALAAAKPEPDHD